ncbi:MAG: ABC transporter permease [Synergistaceae bacterium]|nr:ABC transporter permease [Synergistaceae bacterium]
MSDREEFTPRSKKKSQISEILKRLLMNHAAVVGMLIMLILIFAAIFADYVAPYSYEQQNLNEMFARPSLKHLFGTDNFGRDIFSRVIYGARISLFIGLTSVVLGCISGGALGAIAAYYGGRADNIIMRVLDVMNSIPNLLLAISLSASMGAGVGNAMIAIGITSIPIYARVVRAAVMTVKEQEYIEAARVLGVSNRRIILRHILPNSLAPIIVQASLGIAGAIITTASLSFIGLGVVPPTPEWGGMLSAGRQYIRNHWHMVTFPGLAIMITVMSFNLFGDGLRDALDPRLKR